MTTENLFIQAVRLKDRFDSKVGQLSVEDLWDLPLTSATKANLDDIAIGLSRKLKDVGESFVSAKTAATNKTERQLEIVKYVIQTKQAEVNAILDAKKKLEQRAVIQDLIAKKKNESLESLSVAELEAMIANS